MKISIFIYTLLFSTVLSINVVTAQNNKSSSVSNVTKLNFILPGISYEQKISKFQTLFIETYMNIWVQRNDFYSKSKNTLFIAQTADIQFRNYYNIKSRERRNLRTEKNSSNYFSPIYMFSYIPATKSSPARIINEVGAIWGMQRNYMKRFSIDLNAGLGYSFYGLGFSNKNSVMPIVQASLGFWLNKMNIAKQ